MQKSHFLSLLLAVILLITTYKFVNIKRENKEITQSVTSQREAVLAVIKNRKSVRSYTKETILKSELTTLLKAGMAAPSAGNKQPWAFVVVEDTSLLHALSQVSPYTGMIKNAAAAIVVCGDMNKTFEGEPEDLYWVQDCSAASENILLAVEATGLGAVWTGLYPMTQRFSKVQDILEIAPHLVPLNVIAIGHPDGDTPAKNKWNEENVIWKN